MIQSNGSAATTTENPADAIQALASDIRGDEQLAVDVASLIARQRKAFEAGPPPKGWLERIREKWLADDSAYPSDASIAAAMRFRELRARLSALRTAAGARYHGCRLKNFDVSDFPASVPNARAASDRRRRVRNEVADYGKSLAQNLNDHRGLVLYGPCGTGKDHMLYAIARHTLAIGQRVQWVNGRDLFGDFRDAMDRRDMTEAELIVKYAGRQVLFLSDPLPANGDPLTRYEADCLYRILDDRCKNGMVTMASLNVKDDREADARLGSATWDRLQWNAVTAFCYWASFRTPAKVIS